MEGLAHGRAFQGSLKYVCQEIEKVDAGSWHSRVDLGEPGDLYSCFLIANQEPQLYVTYRVGMIKLSNGVD